VSINTFIDDTFNLIEEASQREQERWGTVPDLEGELDNIKDFIAQREQWITGHAGSFTACTVQLPSLVVSGINYNPGEDTDFPESDEQEFIEITNTGTTTVNLTGIYLRELGVSYQFPADSNITAGEKIYIVSNASVFEAKTGTTPFGEFVRNMSNSNFDIVLADAFGNKIDEVHYYDSAPWPDADGNGNFLHLTSNTLDNALAASWEALSDTTLSNKSLTVASAIKVYPNPVNDMLTVVSQSTIKGIEVYDISGKQLQVLNADSNTIVVNFAQYASGIYFILISGENGTITKKIVRQ
jgi:hypothetical protein